MPLYRVSYRWCLYLHRRQAKQLYHRTNSETPASFDVRIFALPRSAAPDDDRDFNVHRVDRIGRRVCGKPMGAKSIGNREADDCNCLEIPEETVSFLPIFKTKQTTHLTISHISSHLPILLVRFDCFIADTGVLESG